MPDALPDALSVIDFGSTRLPDWAQGRLEEIIGRIKAGFPEPDYEYDER